MVFRSRTLLVGVAVLFALAGATSISVRLFGTSPESIPSLVVGILCGAIALAAMRKYRTIMPAGTRYERFEFVLVTVAAGLALSALYPVAPTIGWRLATGPDRGSAARLFQGRSWGKAGRVFELHANPYAERTTGAWPSRAVAHVQRAARGDRLRIRLRITQPDWSVNDSTIDDDNGGPDGFTVQFSALRRGEWRVLSSLQLNYFARPQDRNWHTTTLDLERDDEAAAVEVLPGDGRSNNWNDRVWINTLSVTARVGGFPLDRLLNGSDAICLFAVALILLAGLERSRSWLCDETPPGAPSDKQRTNYSGYPLSERACDGLCAILAVWTIACHTIVLLGGSLRHLIALALVLGAISALVAAIGRRRREPESRDTTRSAFEDAPFDSRGSRPGALLRTATTAILAALALSLLANGYTVTFWWGCVLVLLRSAVWLALDSPQPGLLLAPRAGRLREAALWSLAVACTGIVLVLHHQGLDDSFYVNVAVAAADHPDWPLMSRDTMHGIPNLPMHMPAHRVQSFELLNGAISYLAGIPAIYVFHLFSAALIALLAPLAVAYLFRRLLPMHWLAATAAVLVILITGGDQLHWYGNEFVSQTWYGKTIYICVLVPLAYAYGLRFGIAPSMRNWVAIAAVQIASVGCTSSAIWSVPIATCLSVACAVRLNRGAPLILASAALSSSYVIAVGLLLKPQMASIAAAIPASTASGALLSGALDAVLGNGRQVIAAFAAVLLVPMLYRCGMARRFATIVPLAILLLILNPYTETRVSRSLTGPAFWRALWSFPAPLLMGMLAVAPLQFRLRKSLRPVGGALTFAALAMFALWIPQASALKNHDATWIAWPNLNVPWTFYKEAQRLNELAPPEAYVLAPQSVAAWLPTMHHHAAPLVVRDIYLRRIKTVYGPVDVQWRLLMTEAVSLPGDLEPRYRRQPGVRRRRQIPLIPLWFRIGLDFYRIQAVCIDRAVPLYPQLHAVLEMCHFTRRDENEAYEIWTRPNTPPRE